MRLMEGSASTQWGSDYRNVVGLKLVMLNVLEKANVGQSRLSWRETVALHVSREGDKTIVDKR